MAGEIIDSCKSSHIVLTAGGYGVEARSCGRGFERLPAARSTMQHIEKHNAAERDHIPSWGDRIQPFEPRREPTRSDICLSRSGQIYTLLSALFPHHVTVCSQRASLWFSGGTIWILQWDIFRLDENLDSTTACPSVLQVLPAEGP